MNGKVERSHRVDDQEFYQFLDKDGITDNIHLFDEKLREWEDYYNYHRPHGALVELQKEEAGDGQCKEVSRRYAEFLFEVDDFVIGPRATKVVRSTPSARQVWRAPLARPSQLAAR